MDAGNEDRSRPGSSPPGAPVRIRRAKPSEAAALSDLALRSKGHWGYSAAFLEACRGELSVSPEDIESACREYRVCEVGDSILGYFALVSIGQDEYELEALFIEPRFIGLGYGRLLMEAAKSLAGRRGAKSLLIQGDPNASRFYRAAGGIRIGERESASIPGRFLPEFRIDLDGDGTAPDQ